MRPLILLHTQVMIKGQSKRSFNSNIVIKHTSIDLNKFWISIHKTCPFNNQLITSESN